MDVLTIQPGIGIGNLKLGMTKDEVNECIQAYKDKYQKRYHSKNFFKNVLRVRYDANEKVNLIEIPYELKEEFRCLLNDIDVFNTKADELVQRIDKISHYDRSNTEMDTCFRFPELGLTLWRPDLFKEENLEEEWFKELQPDIQEDYKKNLYFSSVAVEPPTNRVGGGD